MLGMCIILIAALFPLFNNGIAIFDVLASQDNSLSNVEFNNVVDLSKNQVKGGSVIGFVRYFKRKNDVAVEVTNTHGSKAFTKEGYDKTRFSIDFNDVYIVAYSFEGKELKKITCVKK